MQKHYLNEMTGHGPFTRDEGSPRPNIILISMDMVPVEFHLDLPGHPEVNAPTMRSIRDNHISFSNAFSTSPLCSPSRAAYLSGRHSYITTNAERAHDGQGQIANLCNDPESRGLQTEAVVQMHRTLKHDARWKSYAGFMELTYPELLTSGGGDRQLLV